MATKTKIEPAGSVALRGSVCSSTVIREKYSHRKNVTQHHHLMLEKITATHKPSRA
jgi:hypothetical protein